MQPSLQQLQVKLAELQGEIKIAERQRNQIILDLKELQTTKAKEFESSAKQIKEAKKILAELTIQVQEKRDLYEELTKKQENLQKEMNEYNLLEMQKTEKERNRIILQANETLEYAVHKKDEAETLECEVIETIEAISMTDEQISQERERLGKKENELVKLQKETDESVRKAKYTLAQLNKKRDDLVRDVKDAEKLKATLDQSIEKAIEFIKQTRQEAQSILLEAKRLKVISQKEREDNEKVKKQLAIDRKRLDDAIETNKRAYREIISRGGNVTHG